MKIVVGLEFMQVVHFVMSWTQVSILFLMALEFVDCKGLWKFGIMEILRCRLSLTTCNVAQLLMRLEVKASHVEARSMKFLGSQHDFWRTFNQQVLDVSWMSHNMGLKTMEHHITEFVALKFSKGMDAIPEELIQEFQENVEWHINVKIQQLTEEGQEKNEEDLKFLGSANQHIA